MIFLNQFQNSYYVQCTYVSREIHLLTSRRLHTYIIFCYFGSAVVPMVSDHDLLPKDRGILTIFYTPCFHCFHSSFHEIFLKTEYFLLTWRNDAFAIFWRVSVRALDKNEESYFFIGLKMNKLAIKLVYKSYQNLLNVYHLYSSEIFVKLTNHAVFFYFCNFLKA